MEKKILLAVDESKHAKNAIQYVIDIAPRVNQLTYTLFHVQPQISQFLHDEARINVRAQSAIEKIKKKNAQNAHALLEKYKNLMVDEGIDETHIESKTAPRNLGLAKDIIEFAQKKHYDAVVVGRRGLTKMQEVFMGSLTTKLVEHSQVIPLWIVDGKVTSRRVLVAVDGSESAFRAVDHVSFIFRNNPHATITLFHVTPRLKDYCRLDYITDEEDLESAILQSDKKCIDQFLSVVEKKFIDAGIAREQVIVRQTKPRFSIGDAILEEIQKGDYGTVVIGRRGTERAFYLGRVSNQVLSKTTRRAVWLVA
ncbi:MAG: universal stress protein [Desulfococcus multivorans]|jgi:nucleotide-binding universal stress UspA family protein|uniref:universal stress protein n=1 Tax=Desulfococcus sp. TaxID=2025834 RepID=UPI002A4301A1|nr:universal stress protein [Desulfococcus multivorans]